MFGVRFLDVDFMRINFACPCSTVYLIRLFCTVLKGGAAAWSTLRSQCRMEAPERARSMAARAARPTSFLSCQRTSMWPPGRGDFLVSNFHPGPIPGNLAQTIFGGEGGCWRGKWGGLFWVTSLEKIFGGVIAIVSYRPGGWMQQSPVPRCAILYVGSTGDIGQ